MSINLFIGSQIDEADKQMLLSVKMKNEAVSERSQTQERAGLGRKLTTEIVNGMIDKFIHQHQF